MSTYNNKNDEKDSEFLTTEMKYGIQKPSLKKRVSAKTSLSRIAKHSLGFKTPRGLGIFTHPKKAIYNKIYHALSKGLMDNTAPSLSEHKQLVKEIVDMIKKIRFDKTTGKWIKR